MENSDKEALIQVIVTYSLFHLANRYQKTKIERLKMKYIPQDLVCLMGFTELGGREHFRRHTVPTDMWYAFILLNIDNKCEWETLEIEMVKGELGRVIFK